MSNGYTKLAGPYVAGMKTDALSRRLRYAPPNPLVRQLILTEADHLLFEAIDRHGPLPTHYLYEFVRHVRKDYTHFQHRLTEFYNGDRRGPYLGRPPQQHASYMARYQHAVYDLAPRARTALAERDSSARFSAKRTDPFVHRLMSACVGASLELGAHHKGLRYIPREEILAHPRCPVATKTAINPLAIPIAGIAGQHRLTPDNLFGFEYPGAGFRFFAVEIDRNTESINRSDLQQTAFARKIACYLTALKQRTYTAHWGIPNLSILVVTTNASHARNLVEHIRRHDDPLAGRFAVKSDASFGADWRVPRDLLCDLIDTPWKTAHGPRHIGTP